MKYDDYIAYYCRVHGLNVYPMPNSIKFNYMRAFYFRLQGFKLIPLRILEII
jgi:hypothetical protein